MLIELTYEAFQSLDDKALVWACVEPIILEIRGKNLSVKTQAAAQLNEAQQALLMVQVIYGHSHEGVGGLFASLAYLVSSKGVWDEIAKGFRFFGGEEAGLFVNTLKGLYTSQERPDLDADGIMSAELRRNMERIIQKAAAYVRMHPDEFLQISG